MVLNQQSIEALNSYGQLLSDKDIAIRIFFLSITILQKQTKWVVFQSKVLAISLDTRLGYWDKSKKDASNMSLDNIPWSIRPRSGKIKLGWPASFVAMESDKHLLYCTKLSGKSQDFYFLVGIHIKWEWGKGWPVVACPSWALVVLYRMLTIFACYVLTYVWDAVSIYNHLPGMFLS